MIIKVRNKTEDHNSYRSARVKSLFNAERGNEFNLDANIDIDNMEWQIGLVVGPSGSGKTSIEWAIKMRDFLTGGTTFWLNSGIDRGDIIEQEVVWIDPKMYNMDIKKAARLLWEHELQDIGVRLINKTINDIISGTVKRRPQDNRFSTFEPSLDIKDIFRPDALMLNEKNL